MSTIEFTAESDRIVTAKSGRPRGFIDWKPRATSQKLALPTARAKVTDNRSFDGQGTVQAEAIPPDQLGHILRDALASNFDFDAHEKAKAESDEAAAHLRDEFGLDES